MEMDFAAIGHLRNRLDPIWLGVSEESTHYHGDQTQRYSNFWDVTVHAVLTRNFPEGLMVLECI